MHERSETIKTPSGEWINIYGRGTRLQGQQLPGTKTYPTLEDAVSAAKSRSELYEEIKMPQQDLATLLQMHEMARRQQSMGGARPTMPPHGIPQIPPQGMPYIQPEMMQPGRMQQMSQGMMPPQPPASAVSGVGQMPQMNAPFGSQVKDYLRAGAGALGGGGMALGMGQGVGRAAQGMLQSGGMQALSAEAQKRGMSLDQLLKMLAGRGAQTGQAGGFLGNSGLAGANQIAIMQELNRPR